jgi:UV DNA damage endonuclease
MLATWPAGVRPKVHFSSPRTELRELKRKDPKNRKTTTVLLPPLWTGHADFCHPFEFITFLRLCTGLDFDVMLEAKSKDLALVRLRLDLAKYAPDVAMHFGLHGTELDEEDDPSTVASSLVLGVRPHIDRLPAFAGSGKTR